ncbi:MAG: hypothetical protein OJF51_001660 [Nitrospira sp.]|jgi:hypothetical protein|nr:MAG: hypothetical protein OJF51_001660 [Nitrospira sp.]
MGFLGRASSTSPRFLSSSLSPEKRRSVLNAHLNTSFVCIKAGGTVVPACYPNQGGSHDRVAKPDSPMSRSSTKMNLPTRKNDCTDRLEHVLADRWGNTTII